MSNELFISKDKEPLTLEDIQDIMHEMAEALGDFASAVRSMNAQPYYGRDARNIGVEDGTSFATKSDDWERAYQRACASVDEAIEAGILKERPYDLRYYSVLD